MHSKESLRRLHPWWREIPKIRWNYFQDEWGNFSRAAHFGQLHRISWLESIRHPINISGIPIRKNASAAPAKIITTTQNASYFGYEPDRSGDPHCWQSLERVSLKVPHDNTSTIVIGKDVLLGIGLRFEIPLRSVTREGGVNQWCSIDSLPHRHKRGLRDT